MRPTIPCSTNLLQTAHLNIKPAPNVFSLNESLKWALSLSGLLHIIVTMGLNFYATQVLPTQSKQTLQIQISSDNLRNIEPNENDNPEPNFEATKPSPEVIKADAASQKQIAEQLKQLQERQQQLIAELKTQQQAIEAAPKEIFVTSSTSRNEKLDQYKEDWRKHVEAYGNQHYPERLSQKALSGILILEATIRADGALIRVDIKRSSGNAVIDQSAIEIVKAARPFPVIDDETMKDTDILHIVRTWKFSHNRVAGLRE